MKPTRAERRGPVAAAPAEAPAGPAGASTAPVLTLDPRLDATPTPRAPGARRGTRKKLFRMLPSVPSVVGAVALVVAAGGAMAGQQTAGAATGEFEKFASQASVLNAASSMGSSDALSGRERAVSRDSARTARQDAKDEKLQAKAESAADKRTRALAALAASAEKHAEEIESNAWVLPLPAGSYRLSASFGQCSSLWSSCHTGQDFAAPSGTPIYSMAAGTVTETGYDGAYGNKTVVTLEDGTEIWYCHQTSIGVSVGQRVGPGETIGTVGSTGNSTGPHLHLEVRPGAGDAINPASAASVHGISF